MQNNHKPHVVCVPFPAQGHINPFMKLAKLLHSRNFHVTFVLNHYNHARLLKSRGPRALDGLPSFRFASIPDGLPPSYADATQSIPDLCYSIDRHCEAPLTDLLGELNSSGGPHVTCVVVDSGATYAMKAAEAVGVKAVVFWTASVCGLLGYDQYARLARQGYVPLKDESCLTNGYLETPIDWIPSMKDIRLKDLPSFIRTTDPNDILFNYILTTNHRLRKASAIIFNTFNAFDNSFLAALAPDFPPLYPLGPLHIILDNDETNSIQSNLWKEDVRCLEWLNTKLPGSVVYVNFGSITVMTNDQLVEFAFGLANSEKHFLWVIRPDLVDGESSSVLPKEFLEETKGRSLIVEWCDQERVLGHVAVGGFLTHCGWNSTIESVCAGVPMIAWPFFAEQQTNCWALRSVWGIGMEIESDVRREVVEMQVRELMDGERGEEMRRKAMEWKVKAEEAVEKGSGESWENLEKLIHHVLAP